MELKITDDKVRKAAEECPVAGDVLKSLFPEAFSGYYKGGTVFVLKQSWLDSELCPSRIKNCQHGLMAVPTFCSGLANAVSFARLVMLIHESSAHEYRLIHLATGYSWYPKKTFYRKHPGIQIPADVLENMDFYYGGGGK